MKNIYLILLLLTGGFFMTSCDDEDFTGKALSEPVAGVTATISATGIANAYAEADQDTIRVTLSLNEVQSTANLDFYAFQVDGTAELGSDVVFIDEDGFGSAHKTIPATAEATSLTWSLVVTTDCISEPTESISIQFADERTANADVEPVTIEFNILNYRSDIPSVSMEWGTDEDGEDISFGYGDDNSYFVEDIDLDLYIADADLNIIANYAAATGANPESMDIAAADGSELPDGIYYLYVAVYDTWDTGEGFDPVEYPLFFTFDRCGGDLSGTYTVNGLSTESTAAIVYELTVANGELTVNNGEVDIAQGKIKRIQDQISSLK